jgi:hypothetical protein
VSTKERVVDELHQELVFDDISIDRLEQLFQVGKWHCTMHRFNEAVCIHHSTGEYTGVLVSIDTNAGVNLEAIAEACDEL